MARLEIEFAVKTIKTMTLAVNQARATPSLVLNKPGNIKPVLASNGFGLLPVFVAWLSVMRKKRKLILICQA
jgi:hypothetical protein